jgi:hypothetical protein
MWPMPNEVKGKTYYFSAGRGNSARKVYAAVINDWELTKLGVDASQPDPCVAASGEPPDRSPESSWMTGRNGSSFDGRDFINR